MHVWQFLVMLLANSGIGSFHCESIDLTVTKGNNFHEKQEDEDATSNYSGIKKLPQLI